MKQEKLEEFLKILVKLQSVNPEFPIQYAICLAHIALNEGLSMTELAERTKMALSTVSRITTAMSKSCAGGGCYELIRVEIAPNEKRKKRIALTDKGDRLLTNILEAL